ncbi:MAG: phosphonate C-P lyase system protein PhnH [Spirochaetales bacterium]|nr:phosphonate C-P lyase system protein PhnH [Spirochaetales bacterium]
MIDTVHDIQLAYRQLLKAFAFPGTINTLLENKGDMGFPCEMGPAVLTLAMILLDGEVSACFFGYDDDSLSCLRHLTYLRFAEPAEADFLFFGPVCQDTARQALAVAKTGTLEDPHLGATALISCPRILRTAKSSDVFDSDYISLNGPGIEKDKQKLALLGAHESLWWINERNRLCREFPLGVDIILHDTEMNVLAIPRSCGLSFYPEHKE